MNTISTSLSIPSEFAVLDSPHQIYVRENNIPQDSVEFNTPYDLHETILSIHECNPGQPNRRFLLQHAAKISQLPSNIYHCFSSNVTFQLDSQASLSSVNNRSLFYFYIGSDVSAGQGSSGDDDITCGWGGVLVNLNNRVHLLAPVQYKPSSPHNILSLKSLVVDSGYLEVTHFKFMDGPSKNNPSKQRLTGVHRSYNHLHFAHVDIFYMMFLHSDHIVS